MESLLVQVHPSMLFRSATDSSTQHKHSQHLKAVDLSVSRRRWRWWWLRMMNFKSKDIPGLFTAIEVSAASSAPDYPEQFFGSKMKKNGQRIAGIDQDELLDPKHLADPDSCFSEFKGVDIHYKVCEPEFEVPGSSKEQTFSGLDLERKMIGPSMILIHGFGASIFSWNKVMKPLAYIIGSKVLAFDRPAFGLTSRISYKGQPNSLDAKSLNPYSTLFSVMTTFHFLNILGSDRAVIVGHSAGAFTAVRSYFEAPDRIAALILVAPAIIAPISSPKVVEGDQLPESNKGQPLTASFENSPSLFIKLEQVLSTLSYNIILAFKVIFSSIRDTVILLYKTVVPTILRSTVAIFLVRFIISHFGTFAVRASWYDESKVTDHVLRGYTKPLKAKGWDRALVEYILALLADSGNESKPSQTKGVHEISCPVLIITGDTDRLVPAWNADKLSRVIPRSHLEVIKNCGHLPHEEKPEEFLSVVERFLYKNVVVDPTLPVVIPT